MTAKLIRRRRIIFTVIIVAVFLVFVLALIKIQGVEGEYYASLASYSSTHTLKVDAARGEILDRNGNPIVKNRFGNEIVFIVGKFPSVSEQETRNKVLLSLIELMESQGETTADSIPLYFDENSKIQFSENSDAAIKKLKDNLSLEQNASAEECFDKIIEVYKLSDYSKTDALKIASVCNYMINMEYSASNPYVFAKDVSQKTASIIKENSGFYTGVEINSVTYREYVDSTLAVHVLGPVGAISESEYEELRDKGYSINDTIGKSGIEKVYESYLRGTAGELTVVKLSDGTTEKTYTVKPKQGYTLQLTLDTGIQKAAQQALEDTILSLREKAEDPSNTTIGDVTGGAVVVVNVNDGSILASASYPSYDLNKYFSDYSELQSDKNSPLWNRATTSTYAPGSTIKPLISLAALQEGVITEYSTATCQRVYTYYQSRGGFLLYCLQAHGTLNVREALFHSCNVFYYEYGRELGITAINNYMEKFGLGKRTGVEIDEAQGVMAGPAYRESIGTPYWYEADTSQAAIGQSDNLFTILQLANYCATVANGGTRYQLHYVDKIIDPDSGEEVFSYTTTVLDRVDIDSYNFTIVHDGMKLVGTQGVVGNVMKNIPVSVGAKTGSAQVSGQASNGLFISFAPFDNPEIAIAVVIEQAGSGSSVSPVARDIYKYYFIDRFESLQNQDENTLLK